MKEIKSNPSKIISCYLISSKEEIEVVSIAEVKKLKLTEISIMDRQSNGSFVVKDRIMNTHLICKLVSNSSSVITTEEDNDNKIVIMNNKEMKSLKSIDDKMLSIEKQLDDIEK